MGPQEDAADHNPTTDSRLTAPQKRKQRHQCHNKGETPQACVSGRAPPVCPGLQTMPKTQTSPCGTSPTSEPNNSVAAFRASLCSVQKGEGRMWEAAREAILLAVAHSWTTALYNPAGLDRHDGVATEPLSATATGLQSTAQHNPAQQHGPCIQHQFQWVRKAGFCHQPRCSKATQHSPCIQHKGCAQPALCCQPVAHASTAPDSTDPSSGAPKPAGPAGSH
jgi:hypothetical protein